MQYMYKTLLEWSLHNNRETMKLALPALEAFLYEVNLMIVISDFNEIIMLRQRK